MKTPILALLCCLSTALLASGQVPSLINYQGRLTDANGAAVTGNKNFSINIFDAATGGNLLYSETIGAVTLDSNGVYSFQFGSAGTSNKQVTETIGTTAGTTLVYSKALANSSVVNNSITVTDGTNSWSQSVGNPGAGATATANTIVGFVIGATITNGGSGYTSAPTVTISGNGTGAAATATLTDGVVTGINITSAGSGYTTGATITIAPPVIPFRVEYSSNTITATYASAPTAGQTIAATYRYGTGGIADALGNASEHWMAITVDGVTQGTRQRVLAVPFAQRAGHAKSVDESTLGVSTTTLARLALGTTNDIQLEQYYLATANITGDGVSAPLSINVNNTSLKYSSGYYSFKKNLTTPNIDVFRGSRNTSIDTMNSYVESANCNVFIGLNGGNASMTYVYSDGTNATSSRGGSGAFNYTNPNVNKKVERIDFSIWGAEGPWNQGSGLSDLSAVAHLPGTISINIPNLNTSYKKVLLTVEGIRQAGDTVTFSISDSQGRLLTDGAKEGVIESLIRGQQEGSMVVQIQCSPSPKNFVIPGSLFNKIKLLFLP